MRARYVPCLLRVFRDGGRAHPGFQPPGGLLKEKLWRKLRSPLLIFLVALLLRLGGLTYFRFLHPSPIAGDYWGPSAEIGQIAASVARGQGFSSPYMAPTGPTAQQPPVFPYLVAGVFKLFGIFTAASAFVVLSLDCLFSSITAVFVLLIGKRTFGPTVGVLAAWGWVFWPSAAFTPVTHLWHDSLGTLLFTMAFWATLRMEGSFRITGWLGLGLLWAIAGLTNPAVLAPMPFLLGWLCFRRGRRREPWASQLAAAVLAFALALLPWMVRNYLTFGGRIFLLDDFGEVLHMGNHPGVTAAHVHPVLLPTGSPEEWKEYQTLGESAYMAKKQRQALRYIEDHPITYAKLCVERFGEFWIWTGNNVPFATILTSPGANLIYFLLPALGVWGLFLCFRNRVGFRMPFFLTLCTFPLVYLATAVYPRFRHPIEPELVVLGAYALAVAARRASRMTPETPRLSSVG